MNDRTAENDLVSRIVIAPFFPDDLHEAGDAGSASFAEKRPLYLMGSNRFLTHYRQVIRGAHEGGASGAEVVAALTQMIDTLVIHLFESIIADSREGGGLADSITLIAIGGYGRGELNPFSDIDIMFLYEKCDQSRIEGLAQKLLYFLWDMKLDVGYSVRTISDCAEMAKQDLTVRTSLLDCRYLAGNERLYRDLSRVLEKDILARESEQFIRAKIDELRRRRLKYGSSVYILEPNIKECEGGLRDLHAALWIAKIKYKIQTPQELIIKGILTEEDLGRYREMLSYLWRIRNELHYLAGRKNDQLTFDAQTKVALFLGYHAGDPVHAAEEFMRDYYLHASEVEHFSSLMIARATYREDRSRRILGYFIRRPIGDGFYVLKGELITRDEELFRKDPVQMMRVFEHAQRQGVELGLSVKTQIRRNLSLINDRFRRNRQVNESFFAILSGEKGVAETLRLMHHLRFLDRYIPEFEKICCKVQHDLYHIYTVDIHTLFCVEELEKLWRGERAAELPLLTTLARSVENRVVLLLGVLLHDIGKGEGSRHAERGGAMVPTIARRMGLSREETEMVEFLVKNHLLFAHIAQRRDLSDEKMIVQFARQMKTSEHLKNLYLLTYADIRGVGPDVWNEWKGNLLQELFEKSYGVMERGNFVLEGRSERVRNVRKEILEILEYDMPAPAIKQEIKAMSTRHLLGFPPEQLASHVRMLVGLSPEEPLRVTVDPSDDQGASTITICTFDLPGLFSKIAGVTAANGFNILTADILTLTNGKVLDVLTINTPQGAVRGDEARWGRFVKELGDVLAGLLSVEQLVERRRRSSQFTRPRPASKYPTRIEFDNEISDDYTVIDIYTDDSLGLLYRVTSALTSKGLSIGVARISTKGDQVADVFYVKDIFGHKVTDAAKLDELRTILVEAIGR
ncbi:MAG: [protein-PII] uridylyltransferase [Desulfuromonadia bacterium]